MGHGAAAPLLQRQARLSTVQRLDLAFLIDRQHDGMLRWIDVEADDVADLGGEVWVVGKLELPDLMRPEAVASPNAVHRTDADRAGSGHGGSWRPRYWRERADLVLGYFVQDQGSRASIFLMG